MEQNELSRRFGGISRLYGKTASEKLHHAHVCVVGVGGVGSWAVEALARSGVGKLTLIDLDNVATSNVNRQLHALTSQFGKAKVSAMHERIMEINPHCQVQEIEDFVSESNIADYFAQGFDFVIDAIDQVRVKAAMADYFIKNKQAFIVSGGAGGQRNLALIRTADLSQTTHDPLLANLRYTLRKRYGFPRDTQKKMRVPCVFSTESVQAPRDAVCDTTSLQGLSCAGYGASMLVTATFGLYCATAAIEHIIQSSLSKKQ